eukprot:COSAG01_NODE_30046_length_624_cov_0.874286_1_plen_97_part_10
MATFPHLVLRATTLQAIPIWARNRLNGATFCYAPQSKAGKSFMRKHTLAVHSVHVAIGTGVLAVRRQMALLLADEPSERPTAAQAAQNGWLQGPSRQ